MSTLIFNGQDLADFGVHISGEGTFNAPTRAIEEQIVPGRNGTLIIDGGRWENIMVTYPAYITDDFDDNMTALRSFLASVRGYARLADTYHPNEFRLACFSDEITVRTSGRYNAQGQFDLSFNCKPQRFLTSGEEVTTFDASDLPSESFSGNPATFETDGEYKVSELSVGITPVQSGSGDPSPTNIRPISGRTGMTVDASAINIWDEQTTVGGYYDSTGAWRTDSSILGCANAIPVRPGMQLYCYSANGAAVYVSLFSRMVTIGTSATDAFISRTRRENKTFTIPDGVECMYFNFASTYGATYQNDVSINYPSSEQTMNLAGRIIPIDWQTQAGTVYGGTLDVVSGVLTVDRLYAEFAASGSAYYRLTPNTAYTHVYVYANGSLGRMMPTNESSDITTAVCNMLPPSSRTLAAFDPGVFEYHQGNSHEVRFSFPRESAYDSVDKIYALGLNVVIPLAEPIATYQLTPTEVKTLLGGNTIYTDAGGVDGKYLLPLRITNPTAFEAKPIIRIYGAGTVGIGDVNVTFDGSSEYVDLDCELQDAYYGPTNKNSSVTLDPNRFPVIPASGAGIVLGSGITQVDITPRWFEL